MADKVPATPPGAASTSEGGHEVPDDFCITLREENAGMGRGHFQRRLRVCELGHRAELVRVDGNPEIFDEIHRRVALMHVSGEAIQDLYDRMRLWQTGRWQAHQTLDGKEEPAAGLAGSWGCHLSYGYRGFSRSLDCSPGTVQASSKAEEEQTLAEIRAFVPKATWQDLFP